MAYQLLKQEDVEQLRLASVLSGTPVAQSFDVDGQTIQLVAVNHWVLPKDLFVTLWLWYMLDGKIYNQHMDHKATDAVISTFNPLWVNSSKKRCQELLNRMWSELYLINRQQELTVIEKQQIFDRILDELDSKV